MLSLARLVEMTLSVSGQTLLDLAADEFSRAGDARRGAHAAALAHRPAPAWQGPAHARGAAENLRRPMIELGVNVDHVATVRQARRTYEPDPVWAAVEAHLGGADGITVHLREDRRHIQDEDVRRLRELTHIKLNLEMAATDEMVGIAAAHQAGDGDAGARGAARGHHRRRPGHRRARRNGSRRMVKKLADAGIVVSRVHRRRDPRRSKRRGASAPRSARSTPARMPTPSMPRAATRKALPLLAELEKIQHAGEAIRALGMRFNAGHALNYFNVQPVAALPGRARAAHRPRHRVARVVRRHARGGARDESADGASRAVIFGVGTDVVEIDRIAQGLERCGERFAERILSPAGAASASSLTASRRTTWPSASPPRKRSPRRSAPASRRPPTGTASGWRTCPRASRCCSSRRH